ncbi:MULTISPECIES: DUF3247 family protein [unclassified Luteimonas]|uniref:DUF3247 family protein n=1 Tax=unclassified Luteimonas TaxID=2629088 RepID=UPI0018F0EF49|nr:MULTISPECIES: DUF3247 family protein [unclassified Luteimonas]MBJ6980722.1 DUF3247 family protein [Luteimonas sp. MC1572]MBJ7574014.1 DUF3247 family protein [Luteimonas sp. MC1828]QQO02093.1 DUF3247 family protein [Luteimonas sp. MC1572]
MGQVAPRVLTRNEDIRAIEARSTLLPDEAIVAVTMRDGSLVQGTVAMRPIVQVFMDTDGHEGLNAVVRIDDAHDPTQSHYLWLDAISAIRQLGTA